jgi:nucleotide-binding universal stress UspA family protein
MFRRILVSTNLTDGLYRLGQFLPSLAAGGIEQIVFLHCVPFWSKGQIPREDTDKIKQAQERLSFITENIPNGMEVAIEIKSGLPIDHILKVAQTYKSEAILVGTEPKTLLTDQIFGATIIDLSARIKIPLINFPTPLLYALTAEEMDLRCRHLFRYVGIPYDDTDASHQLVAEFKRYGAQRPANSLERCMLGWIIDAGILREVPKDSLLKEAQEKLAAIKTELAGLGLQVDVEVRLGEPVPDILQIAAMSDICAIAVAGKSLGGSWEWGRNVRRDILRGSSQPVIFFPLRS